jgi:hypothetical protein
MAAYSSSEAAQMLSIAPITLRKLSSAFAAWLSPAAAGTAMVGEAWDRFYSDDDLDMLRYIIILLKQNRHYSWVRERLTVEFGAGDPASAGAGASDSAAEAIGPQPPDGADVEVLESGGQPSADARAFEAEEAPDSGPQVVEAEVVEPQPHVPPDIAAMLARIAELYQELLRNKEQEIAALRQALDVTELAAANERRELEMLNRLAKIMERENQRLTAELEEARRQLGQAPAHRRGWLARVFGGGDKEASSAPQM